VPTAEKRTGAPLIEVRESPIAGHGVFAARRIRRGTRIIEYVGERISSAEADERYDDDAMTKHHTVLFAVDDDLVIDAAVGGNDARFINHGCAPNCEAVNEDGRIFIEAIADIPAGTELVYDYSLTRDEPWDDRWASLYACHCGAAGCRGTILKSPRPPAKRAPRKQSASRERPATRKRRSPRKRAEPS
jgi:SET domain-containing protein